MDIIPEERIELGLPPFLYVGVDVFDSWGGVSYAVKRRFD
jgi:hypothetical protein